MGWGAGGGRNKSKTKKPKIYILPKICTALLTDNAHFFWYAENHFDMILYKQLCI